jgi:hypothetical protein
MAWCAGALTDCLPGVGGASGGGGGGGGYKAVSTVNDDDCVAHDGGAGAALAEQSTTWADGSTLHLDGTVSAELLQEAAQREDGHDVSAVSNLDAKTEAWLSGACAALDDITASPLSANGRSDRSGLSAEIAAALNSGVSRVISAVSTTSSVIDDEAVEGEGSLGGSFVRPSPRFSSHPSRGAKQATTPGGHGERSFGSDRTNSLAADDSPGPGMNMGLGKKARQNRRVQQQRRQQQLAQAAASPASSPAKIAPPPSSPVTE